MRFTTDGQGKVRKAEVVRLTGKCEYCPLHGGENASRKPKHGTQKPRKRIRRKELRHADD